MRTPAADDASPQAACQRRLSSVMKIMVGLWVAFIILYAMGIGWMNGILVPTGGGHAVQVFSDSFVRDRLRAPFAFPRANLRGSAIGPVTAFADRLLADTPERATIYVQFDPEDAPSDLTPERWHGVCFDNYAYLAYRLYPRRVHVTTPGAAIRDPVFFPMEQTLLLEEVGLPRSLEWLLQHEFDYHVIYLPFVGVGHYGRISPR